MASVPELFGLTAEVQTALNESDRHRAESMAKSLHGHLLAEGKEIAPHVVVEAVVRALEAGDAIENPYRYARQVVLGVADEAMESRLEAESRENRRESAPARAAVAAIDSGRPGTSNDPELDEFDRAMQEALARKPIVLLALVPGGRPTESAREKIISILCLFYRSAGMPCGEWINTPAGKLPLCLRRSDLGLAQTIAWNWYRLVEEQASARRSGAAIIPEIPNAYNFALDAIITERRRAAGCPREEAPEKRPDGLSLTPYRGRGGQE